VLPPGLSSLKPIARAPTSAKERANSTAGQPAKPSACLTRVSQSHARPDGPGRTLPCRVRDRIRFAQGLEWVASLHKGGRFAPQKPNQRLERTRQTAPLSRAFGFPSGLLERWEPCQRKRHVSRQGSPGTRHAMACSSWSTSRHPSRSFPASHSPPGEIGGACARWRVPQPCSTTTPGGAPQRLASMPV